MQNPPLVFGPILHEVASPEALNTSVANFYKVVSGQVTEADLPGGGGNWIDVREGACLSPRAVLISRHALTRPFLALHPSLDSLQRPRPRPDQARGRQPAFHHQRRPLCDPASVRPPLLSLPWPPFQLTPSPPPHAEFTEFLASYAPDLPNIPKGKAGAVAEANDPKNVLVSSGAKAERELGIVYRPIEESAKDSAFDHSIHLSLPTTTFAGRPLTRLPSHPPLLAVYESLKARGW